MTAPTPRKTKIVATLGPASNDRASIEKLLDAGANVFRLNMSHGQHENITRIHGIIRALEAERGQPIGILGDLQGPKLRCGSFENGAGHVLEVGQSFRLDLDMTPGTATRVGMPHPEIFQALEPGATLLINDGAIRLKVQNCDEDHAECLVEVGGKISDRKGINVPDVELPLAALSEKDLADLEFLCELGIDWLALSFVQRAADIMQARELVKGRARLMAKIEKPNAVARIDEILDVTDSIMVARGDLGVEMPVEAVPPIQKDLIVRCRQLGKPVIVATQMLESMVNAPVPTRAEVNDVATAIYDGADAVMLSAESAAGSFPSEAVATMDAVARRVEADPLYARQIAGTRSEAQDTDADAITVAAREISETRSIAAICCHTQSGSTAFRAARERPLVPLVAVTSDVKTARALALLWGTNARLQDPVTRFRDAAIAAAKAVTDLGFAAGRESIVVTAGVPLNTTGTTNILRIVKADCSNIGSAA